MSQRASYFFAFLTSKATLTGTVFLIQVAQRSKHGPFKKARREAFIWTGIPFEMPYQIEALPQLACNKHDMTVYWRVER